MKKTISYTELINEYDKLKPSQDLLTQYPLLNDKDAQTISEIVEQTGLSATTVIRLAKDMVKRGQWVSGFRKGARGFVKVYAKKK